MKELQNLEVPRREKSVSNAARKKIWKENYSSYLETAKLFISILARRL